MSDHLLGVALNDAEPGEVVQILMGGPQWCSGRCDCGQPCSKLSREGHLIHVCLIHDVV